MGSSVRDGVAAVVAAADAVAAAWGALAEGPVSVTAAFAAAMSPSLRRSQMLCRRFDVLKVSSTRELATHATTDSDGSSKYMGGGTAEEAYGRLLPRIDVGA